MEKTKVGVIAQLGLGLAKDPMMSIMELNSGYWSVSTNNYASAVAFKFGGQAKINFAKNFYATVSANLMAADLISNKPRRFIPMEIMRRILIPKISIRSMFS